MASKYCEKLPRCKNAWWCATDYKPSKNVRCFDAMTNYERIKSKTPEELAEWIAGSVLNLTGGALKMAKEAWLDWLKRNVEEKKT